MTLYLKNKALPTLNVLGNGSELPARIVDALEVLAIEENRTDNEISAAIRAK